MYAGTGKVDPVDKSVLLGAKAVWQGDVGMSLRCCTFLSCALHGQQLSGHQTAPPCGLC